MEGLESISTAMFVLLRSPPLTPLMRALPIGVSRAFLKPIGKKNVDRDSVWGKLNYEAQSIKTRPNQAQRSLTPQAQASLLEEQKTRVLIQQQPQGFHKQ